MKSVKFHLYKVKKKVCAENGDIILSSAVFGEIRSDLDFTNIGSRIFVSNDEAKVGVIVNNDYVHSSDTEICVQMHTGLYESPLSIFDYVSSAIKKIELGDTEAIGIGLHYCIFSINEVCYVLVEKRKQASVSVQEFFNEFIEDKYFIEKVINPLSLIELIEKIDTYSVVKTKKAYDPDGICSDGDTSVTTAKFILKNKKRGMPIVTTDVQRFVDDDFDNIEISYKKSDVMTTMIMDRSAVQIPFKGEYIQEKNTFNFEEVKAWFLELDRRSISDLFT